MAFSLNPFRVRGRSMTFKRIVIGVLAAPFVLIFAVAALGAIVGPQYRATTAEASPAAAFVRTCRGTMRDAKAPAICACMAENLEPTLNNEQEYALAGAIMSAIVSSGTNRFLMQTKLSLVSQDFHNKVSLERKAAILQAVSREGVTCGTRHTQ